MPYKRDYELIHMMRWRVRMGVKIKTRCGFEVQRTHHGNPTLFKSKSKPRVKCTYAGSRVKPTCIQCCRLMNLPHPLLGGELSRTPARFKNRSQTTQGENDGTRQAGQEADDSGAVGIGEQSER